VISDQSHPLPMFTWKPAIKTKTVRGTRLRNVTPLKAATRTSELVGN